MTAEPIALQEIVLKDPSCDPSSPMPERASAAPDVAEAAKASSSAASATSSDDEWDSASDGELDFEQLDGLAAQDTEEALERLKRLVCTKSRKLSLSRHDREVFARLTEKYFSELKSLSREMEARQQQQQPSPAEHECQSTPPSATTAEAAEAQTAASPSSRPPSRTPSKASSEASAAKASIGAPSEASSGEVPHHVAVDVEASVSSAEGYGSVSSSRMQKRLLFPEEHAALFQDNTEENQALFEALQRFLSEDRNYFHSISLMSLFKVFRYLLLYHLESEYDYEVRHNSQFLTRATDTLMFYKRLFDTGLAPHMFRQVYEVLTETQTHLQVSIISDRINHQDNYHDIFMLHGLLIECFQVYQSRTGVPHGMERMKFRCPATCSLCLLDEQLVVARTCCGQHVCYACYTEWVRTKVFSRTVEVGCPCCSGFLTVNEIIEFLGDRAERYYEILTDLNGDPNKKTCPQCNLVTKNPNAKANKRAGGELTRCQRCDFDWCFRCHSPPHPSQSCSANTSGKQMLQDWGHETYFDGSQFIRKARKCPACKVFIEKNQGCNHMTCNRCNYQFCYVCGKNWRAGNLIFGRHSSRLSIFGCKQKLFPERPALRKLVRGTLFVLEAAGIVIAVPIALALVIGLSPILGAIGIGVAIYKCKH